VIKLGTTVAEEVVTGLIYLGVTSVDRVEYSGLVIDGSAFPLALITKRTHSYAYGLMDCHLRVLSVVLLY